MVDLEVCWLCVIVSPGRKVIFALGRTTVGLDLDASDLEKENDDDAAVQIMAKVPLVANLARSKESFSGAWLRHRWWRGGFAPGLGQGHAAGARGLVVRTQVDGLGVVVTPGGESVIACALAGTPVHLDLHPTHLGTPVVKRSGGQGDNFISAI